MEKNIVDRIDVHATAARANLSRIAELLRFQRKNLQLDGCYFSWARDHVAMAMEDYFVERKTDGLKQHLYMASRLTVAALSINSYQRFSVGSELLEALLSDSPILIDTLASLEPAHYVNHRTNPLHSEFLVHMYQLAIRGDYEALQGKVNHLSKNGRKKDRELSTQSRDFFSLLMQADKPGLEGLITQHAQIRSADPLTEDLMCSQGTLEAKICWLKGIEVQVDSPLLPMGLMPIEPLEYYDDIYDFLLPGYSPPKVGILEKFSYWRTERSRNKGAT